jgi:hypothetical protein
MNEKEKRLEAALNEARESYAGRKLQESFQDFSSVVEDRELALSVCNALIQNSIDSGAMAEDSVLHHLEIALMDYLRRT